MSQVLQEQSAIEDALIGLVAQREYLYDLSHPSYKDKLLKQNAWKDIGIQLDKTGDEAASMWKNLKKQYTTYLKKLKGITGDGKKKVTFRHSLAMAFYKDLYRCYSTTSTNVQEPEAFGDSQLYEPDFIGEVYEEAEISSLTNEVASGSLMDDVSIASPSPSSTRNPVSSFLKTRDKRRMHPADKKIIELLEKSSEPEKLDEFDHYGSAVAIKLRRIAATSRRKSAETQIEIDKLLLQFSED